LLVYQIAITRAMYRQSHEGFEYMRAQHCDESEVFITPPPYAKTRNLKNVKNGIQSSFSKL
jgi:hypothetical protein